MEKYSQLLSKDFWDKWQKSTWLISKDVYCVRKRVFWNGVACYVGVFIQVQRNPESHVTSNIFNLFQVYILISGILSYFEFCTFKVPVVSYSNR